VSSLRTLTVSHLSAPERATRTVVVFRRQKPRSVPPPRDGYTEFPPKSVAACALAVKSQHKGEVYRRAAVVR